MKVKLEMAKMPSRMGNIWLSETLWQCLSLSFDKSQDINISGVDPNGKFFPFQTAKKPTHITFAISSFANIEEITYDIFI